jgi:integrin beta 2
MKRIVLVRVFCYCFVLCYRYLISPEETDFLLYAKKLEVRGVDLHEPYYNQIPALRSPAVNSPLEIDYDNSEKWLFWVENDDRPPSQHGIRRSTINGSYAETIIDSGSASFCAL